MSEELPPPVRSERIYEGEVIDLRVSHYLRAGGVEVRREVIDARARELDGALGDLTALGTEQS